jgi:hypothetical protein
LQDDIEDFVFVIFDISCDTHGHLLRSFEDRSPCGIQNVWSSSRRESFLRQPFIAGFLTHYSIGQALGKRVEAKIFCLHPQVSEANDPLPSIGSSHVL